MRENPEFVSKKPCVYSYMLTLSHLHSALRLIQHTCRDFSPRLKTVFELVGFDAFYRCCRFLFRLFHIGKTFPFGDFFHLGKQKKSRLR